MESLTDHALMLKVKSGDLDKMALLYSRYSRRLFGFYVNMTGDPASSEDLVHNVFMRMLKYRHTYAEKGNFETWVFHLARNVHHDHYRKNKRYAFQQTLSDSAYEPVEDSNREAELVRDEAMQNLRSAINALPPEKRELIELTRFQQLKYHQVAKILGISESAVKVRIHRTLKELRTAYAQIDG